MLLSVIVPIYNGQDYLEEAVTSVLNQPFRELEVICINDGSKDRSLEILENLSQKDSRIRIVTQKNQGVAKSRNKGIELARGRYIAFLDQDDQYCRNAVNDEVMNRIGKAPYDLVSFSYYETNQNITRGRYCPRNDSIIYNVNQRGGKLSSPLIVFLSDRFYKGKKNSCRSV